MGSLNKSRFADQEVEALDKLNREVNTTRAFEKGKAGWQLNEIEPGGKGDCDSFAVTKLNALKKAGYDPKKMHLDVYQLWDGQDHAVATVNVKGKNYFLDNRSDTLQEQPPGTFRKRVRADELDQFKQSLTERNLLKG